MKKISLPKIGIRPVIDGRRMGVRESLEEQKMNMAKATAALLTEKLRHACGAAVECVISDTCIAGMAEAAACEEKFSSQNVGLTITVTPCWCYGSETSHDASGVEGSDVSRITVSGCADPTSFSCPVSTFSRLRGVS